MLPGQTQEVTLPTGRQQRDTGHRVLHAGPRPGCTPQGGGPRRPEEGRMLTGCCLSRSDTHGSVGTPRNTSVLPHSWPDDQAKD